MKSLPFEEWVKYVFNRREAKKHWYWNETTPPKFLSLKYAQPRQVLEYITRLFTNADAILKPYSNWQIADGLTYIANEAFATPIRIAFNPTEKVEKQAQLACIQSMYSLFEQVFARRCDDFLCYMDMVGVSSRINGVCYMWWDVLPIHGHPEQSAYAEYDQAHLEVMHKTLQLKSMACRESALHGLGHWHHNYRSQVETIVQQFLDANPDLDADLRQYAMNAKYGRVQ